MLEMAVNEVPERVLYHIQVEKKMELGWRLRAVVLAEPCCSVVNAKKEFLLLWLRVEEGRLNPYACLIVLLLAEISVLVES